MSEKQLDITYSRQMVRLVGRHARQCWRNALIASRTMPKAFYVEGWAVASDGLVIEHGWIEQDEKIIDPTLYDKPPKAYFAGLLFDHAQVAEMVKQSGGKLPFAHEVYNGAHDIPEYRAAFDAAMAASRKSNQP